VRADARSVPRVPPVTTGRPVPAGRRGGVAGYGSPGREEFKPERSLSGRGQLHRLSDPLHAGLGCWLVCDRYRLIWSF
jgi:hypothetical protein